MEPRATPAAARGQEPCPASPGNGLQSTLGTQESEEVRKSETPKVRGVGFSARSQLRAQQLINYDERRRQTRRDAYAAFLGHLARIRAPLTECLEDLHRPSPDLQAITDRLERTRLEAAQNDSFSYLVMLEGPEMVSDIATQTMEALDAMNGLIREHCKRLQAGKDTSETEPLIENLGQGIGTYGAAFLAAAREAIKLKSEPVKSKIRDQRITLDL